MVVGRGAGRLLNGERQNKDQNKIRKRTLVVVISPGMGTVPCEVGSAPVALVVHIWTTAPL